MSSLPFVKLHFPLRPGLLCEFRLPQDITKLEVERLIKFLDLLCLPENKSYINQEDEKQRNLEIKDGE